MMISKEEAFKRIKGACKKRICEVYPAGIPDFAQIELDWELDRLEKSEFVLEFEMYRLASEAAKRGFFPVVNINTYMIGYLLGYMTLNPLNVHYYCPKCGKYEMADNSLTEFELPDKKCKCGCEYNKYGMNVQRVFIWGLDKSKKIPVPDIRCCEEMIPFVKNAIIKEFDENLLKYIAVTFASTDMDGNCKRRESCGGFAVVPADYQSEILSKSIRIGKYESENTVSLNEVHTNAFLKISCVVTDMLSEIYKMQQETGVYIEEINYNYEQDVRDICDGKCNKYIADFNKIYQTIKPDSFKRLSELFAIDKNTYSDYNKFESNDGQYSHQTKSDYRNHLIERYNSLLSSDYPIAFRDDIYYHLKKIGLSGEELKKAYVIFNKNISIRNTEKNQETIAGYNIPEPLLKELNLRLYCFPKSGCYEYAKCYITIAEYLRMMKNQK